MTSFETLRRRLVRICKAHDAAYLLDKSDRVFNAWYAWRHRQPSR